MAVITEEKLNPFFNKTCFIPLQVRTALTLEAREEARRFFDQERVKLLQEIVELKNTKKQTDEALSNMIQADKMKAGDLRVEHQQHQEQISKIKWDCERDVRRLVCTDSDLVNREPNKARNEKSDSVSINSCEPVQLCKLALSLQFPRMICRFMGFLLILGAFCIMTDCIDLYYISKQLNSDVFNNNIIHMSHKTPSTQ